MKIGIIGLGLMGGSLAKALRRAECCEAIFAYDTDANVLLRAQSDGVIDRVLEQGSPALAMSSSISSSDNAPAESNLDVLFIALRPQDAIDYIKAHGSELTSTLVVDFCGVKRVVADAFAPLAVEYGFSYIGAHPMAGKERGGYESSEENLFDGASMIMCPTGTATAENQALLDKICSAIGITETPHVTPAHHDSLIAYTSQLAHVVSNAYVKSPNAPLHDGFSAGSLLDLTRVARLDAAMWAELFIDNADNLLSEIQTIRTSLGEYEEALLASDRDRLHTLLSAGSEIKAALDQSTAAHEIASSASLDTEESL